MQRHVLSKLQNWYQSPIRKPLVIQGARQVGKTWMMRHFGEQYFKKIAYINFDNNQPMKALFDGDFDIQRLLLGLQIESGVDIKPDDTLLIFDEIQEVPKALSALKYFYENAPEYSIITAGSLLGISVYQGLSFPVGKVDFLAMYPMDFIEFLWACGESRLVDLLRSQDWQLITTLKSKFIERLRQYYFVGGMPEAVDTFVKTQNFAQVRQVQNNLLMAYEYDFSKHIRDGKIIPKVRAVWQSLPEQLAKENKKFVANQAQSGARLKDFESAIGWLVASGLVQQIFRVTKPNLPLVSYQDNVFKLYFLDVGLLAAKSGLDVSALLEGNRLFTEFKEALTEQYVLQQLLAMQSNPVFYWANERSTAEVDFIVQLANHIVPIEVKAEENLKAKSLRSYHDQFSPDLTIRTSMSDYREQDWMVNLPLYAFSHFKEFTH
ncbi:ATPase [Moraxellaceae bacterium 17A]|nr:ATPase [Moraxellaceae bacterium 17A]